MTCLENGSFVVAAGIQTCSDQNCDRRRKTENGAKSNAAGWLGNGLSRRFLFPEGRTYSPPPKCAAFWRWWYPDRVVPTQSGRALCEADFVLCGERRTMRAALLSSAQLSALSWTAHPGIVRDAAVHCAARHLLFAKPVKGWFCKSMGLRTTSYHIAKHLKNGVCRSGRSPDRPWREALIKTVMAAGVCGHYRKGGKVNGNLPPGGKGRQSRGGTVRLRSGSLSELFQDLQQL